MRSIWFTRVGFVIALMSVPIAVSAPAQAADGVSTPGVTVRAQNPAWRGAPSSLRITMTAHSEAASVVDPSCRPKDANLRCWGSLVVVAKDFGGMTLKGFEVHRVAVGGSEESTGHHELTVATRHRGSYPMKAYVNGLSTIVKPGFSGLPSGAKVQVKLTLTDNGAARYADAVDIVVNEFVDGPVKPLIYDSGEQIIQQVAIHGAD
jgi:hypothetical protein